MSLLRIQQEVEDYLQKRILSLLGGTQEDAARYTILGSDINEIRHIFYYLRSNRSNVQVQYLIETYQATVTEVRDTTATIRVPGFEESPFRRIKLRFSMMNTFYQFEVLIHSIRNDEVVFHLPLSIQAATRRKYPRHRVDRSYAYFNILYRPVYGTRGIGQIVEEKHRYLIQELRKDRPDLSLMLRIIGERLTAIAGDYELRLYAKDQPLSLMEGIISNQDKTLFLANTEDINAYIRKPESNLLTSYDREFREMANARTEEDAIQRFKEIQTAEMRRHIYCYVCSPLHLFGSVIGHLYLETDLIHRKKIFADDAVQVGIMADLLSYAMTKTVIAQTYFQRPLAEVANLSLAGVLMRLQSRTIYEYLIDHDILKTRIPLVNEHLAFHGEITRMYSDEDHFYVALKFTQGADDDYRKLEQYLFSDARQRLRGKSRGQLRPLTELHE